ncbi:MAG: hypothetical protein QOH14_3831 [Pseudonocardiales bacterium]|nr:hypothetical protein [Pseudonocardiales bacterium]
MDVKTKIYPIPGAAEGAVGEYTTDEGLRVLDDFHESGYLVRYHDALLTGDREAFDDLISDQTVYVAERFGKGQTQTKADVMATFGTKKVVNVAAHTRDHCRLIPVGSDTVVMTGRSTSEFTYRGRTSRGPRIFAQAYMRLDGRWQCFIHSIMDYDGWL